MSSTDASTSPPPPGDLEPADLEPADLEPAAREPARAESPAARRFVGVVLAGWLVLGLAGVALRESPYFRPWERLTREDAWTFVPGGRVEMEARGDLGALQGVRSLQAPRPVTFSVDARGFRNPAFERLPRVVVVGDSYVAGSGLSDPDTVSARLSEHLGEPAYNYGLQTGYAPLLLLQDEAFAAAPPRLVIFAPVSRRILPLPQRAPARPKSLEMAIWRRPGPELSRWCRAWQRDNGLSGLALRSQQELLYRAFGLPDLIFPEGSPALALDLDTQGLCVPAAARGPEQLVEALVWMQAEWAKRGTRFVFSPIPESGTIYPELFPPEAQARLARPSYLDQVLERAEAQGVPAVDLRPPLRASRWPYLYLRDDSHWAPRAADLCAQAWAESPPVRAALAGR